MIIQKRILVMLKGKGDVQWGFLIIKISLSDKLWSTSDNAGGTEKIWNSIQYSYEFYADYYQSRLTCSEEISKT